MIFGSSLYRQEMMPVFVVHLTAYSKKLSKVTRDKF